MWTLLLALAQTASAATPETPYLWYREAVGVSAFPSGLITDTRVQLRGPMHRSGSIVFRDTYWGVGGRVAATPAFTAVGPRLSIAPIDVFDLDVQASWIGYYGPNGLGLVGMDEVGGKLQTMRTARAEHTITGGAWQVSAAPTLKAKLGPIIALDSWTFAWTSIAPGQEPTTPYVYEPFFDQVVAFDDLVIEQQGALILEVIPDEGATTLWIGATARDRSTLKARDRSTTVGGMVRFRPGQGRFMPTFIHQTLFYVVDKDRVGMAPNIAFLVEWKGERELGR